MAAKPIVVHDGAHEANSVLTESQQCYRLLPRRRGDRSPLRCMVLAMRLATLSTLLALVCACAYAPPPSDDPDPGSSDPDAQPPGVADPCADPVAIPTTGHPLDVMPADRLATFASRAPCLPAGAVRDVIESPRTVWYDHAALTPGYQDSFGDNVVAPIGFRPNTIDPQLIDLAVPGGHAQIFQEVGVFQFPFGRPIGPATNVVVADFWRLPDAAPDRYLPAVHWRRDPNTNTHRIEWMFPKGTVFGELMFLEEADTLYPFEIRTRTRTLDGWAVDVLRPFPTAGAFADAIEQRRTSRPDWAASSALDALVAQLRGGGLSPFHLAATHFPGAFPARDAGIEELPELTGADAELVHDLLFTTPFVSVRGTPWKQDGALVAWAPGAVGTGSIVPRGYNAAAIEVSEESCSTCHRDAGRPFANWYDDILAYGELWGDDEIFSWHPFALANFVDANGDVVNFNYDNRQIRTDFTTAGLIAPYDPTVHTPASYQRIARTWTDFAY